jgi:hypothetical protein
VIGLADCMQGSVEAEADMLQTNFDTGSVDKLQIEEVDNNYFRYYDYC